MSESNLTVQQSPHPIPLPDYRARGLEIRAATLTDVPFMDSLQKLHTKQVGWMPTAQFEGKIRAGHVLIAEEPSPLPSPGIPGEGERVGYCIGNDQYFKRDDCGIIYQMNVVPGKQRSFVGATLLKAMFDRSAYGCKLFCCWCAQDIEANRFWESMGFVPLAFRAGSRGKGRVHIFWQRRIRAGDTTTPYWFPSQTTAGAIREDRLVLPIPPGTHWSDAKPIVLPTDTQPRQLEDAGAGRSTAPRIKPAVTIGRKRSPLVGGLKFHVPAPTTTKTEKPKRQRSAKIKNDPKHVAAARELRDRWLEQVNATPLVGHGKYEVSKTLSAVYGSKALAAPTVEVIATIPALPAPDSTGSPRAIAA